MPENPQTPPPYQPVAPWLRDMVTEKPVAKPVLPPIVEEKKVAEEPKLGVPPVAEEVSAPVVAPAVDTPVVPEAAVPAPVAPVTPVSTAPTSPLK